LSLAACVWVAATPATAAAITPTPVAAVVDAGMRHAPVNPNLYGMFIEHAGAVSLMPADNVQGWRHEVVEVLKSLRSGVYRWPGGNSVSAHDWRDAIGDPDRRPPVFDPVWRAL
jgi:alpha-L-arabinofuranosidase